MGRGDRGQIAPRASSIDQVVIEEMVIGDNLLSITCRVRALEMLLQGVQAIEDVGAISRAGRSRMAILQE